MAGTFALGTSIASAQDVALPGDPSDAEAQGEAMMDAAPDPRVGEPSEPAPDAVAEEPIATPTTPASVVAGGSDLMAEQAEAEARVAGEDDAPATVDTPSDCSGSVERPGCKYYFLGAMYRHTWTPGFILNLFTEDATKTNNVSFGLSFSYRKDGLSVVTDLYWQRFAHRALDPGPRPRPRYAARGAADAADAGLTPITPPRRPPPGGSPARQTSAATPRVRGTLPAARGSPAARACRASLRASGPRG